MTEPPQLPYEEADGTATAGWAGSDTSRERAVREATDGTASARQRYALDEITASRGEGMTWKDLADVTGWHHGQASGVLSVLHKTGALARLAVRRDKCLIYVHPLYVNDRPLSPQRSNGGFVLSQAEVDALHAAHERLGRLSPETSAAVVCLYARDLRLLVEVIEKRII